jgi:DNA-binding transcriptional MerR regulator
VKVYTEKELTKAYYSISEVAAMFDVNTSLIRFWHKEFGKYIKPKTNAKGNRMFTPKDVVNFSKIYQLVKIQGFTLEGAKKTLKSKEPEPVFTGLLPFEEDIKDTSAIKAKLLERLEKLKKEITKLNL